MLICTTRPLPMSYEQQSGESRLTMYSDLKAMTAMNTMGHEIHHLYRIHLIGWCFMLSTRAGIEVEPFSISRRFGSPGDPWREGEQGSTWLAGLEDTSGFLLVLGDRLNEPMTRRPRGPLRVSYSSSSILAPKPPSTPTLRRFVSYHHCCEV